VTTPYRVYIAAASVPTEIQRVEHWAANLKRIGVEVVSTWPQNVRDVGVANPHDGARDQRREWALTCANQVALSNTLWLMCPPDGVTTRGAWFELGIAYACSTDIICSGDTKQTIFTSLADEECNADYFAFGVIKVWAEEYAARQQRKADKTKRTRKADKTKRTRTVRK